MIEALLRAYDRLDSQIQVVIMPGITIQQLNRDYRGVDANTDVLSFPAPPNPMNHLGEIVLSVEFVRAGAKVRKVRMADEAAWLALHGGLHLLGMDDETESQRQEMLAAMVQIAQEVGLPADPEWESISHEVIQCD